MDTIVSNNVVDSDNGVEWSISLYYEGQDVDFEFE